MSTEGRHAEYDQEPKDLPTMTLAEPTTSTGDTPEAHADAATAPADPSTGHPEPTVTSSEASAAVRSAAGDTTRHGEGADSGSSQPVPADAYPSTTRSDESTIAGAGSPANSADASRSENEMPSDTSLFADDQLAGLRARWDSVQAGFVDDPKDCVHKADGLVSDVVGQLTTGFTEARSRLEEQWSRGEEPSTEDLRVALRRYRDFFERLLAV